MRSWNVYFTPLESLQWFAEFPAFEPPGEACCFSWSPGWLFPCHSSTGNHGQRLPIQQTLRRSHRTEHDFHGLSSTTKRMVERQSLDVFFHRFQLGMRIEKTIHSMFPYSFPCPIWGFPKIGVALNHPFLDRIFHFFKHPAMGVAPFLESSENFPKSQWYIPFGWWFGCHFLCSHILGC